MKRSRIYKFRMMEERKEEILNIRIRREGKKRYLEFMNSERKKEESKIFRIRNERRKKGRDVEFTNLEGRKGDISNSERRNEEILSL